MTYRKKYHLETNMKKVRAGYADGILTEYRQSLDEGLDVQKYEDLFHAVGKMDGSDPYKAILSDSLFEMIADAPMREDYAFKEPSSPEEIPLPEQIPSSLPSRESSSTPIPVSS